MSPQGEWIDLDIDGDNPKGQPGCAGTPAIRSRDESTWTWTRGDPLRHDLGIPGDLPGGEYDVLLNLPDPAGTLRNRPEFSIHVANAAAWEASTGFNRLNHRVIIDASARGSAYRGDLVFTSR